MANSLTWDGVDLSTKGLTVEAPSVPVMPDSPISSSDAIHGDSQFSVVNQTTRTVTLSVSVTGTSQANLQSNMEYITRVLDPVAGADTAFTLDYDPNRRYVGRVASMSAPDPNSGIGFYVFVFGITIQCMAHKQGTTETNTAVALATSPDTESIGVVTGSASRIPCEIYTRNTTGADLTATAITITNDTTSESIIWTGTLEDDRWLKIGSLDALGRFTATIEKSDSTGSDPEAETYQGVEAGYTSGDWPRLRGGVDNSFTITGIATGTLEITYRARFLH